MGAAIVMLLCGATDVVSSLSLWSSLQSGMKTTSPLYAWNKSHLEDQYFGALKVDPMVNRLLYYHSAIIFSFVFVTAGLYNIVIC